MAYCQRTFILWIMKPQQKLCDGCGKVRPIWKNINGERFCKYCAIAVSTKKSAKGVQAPRTSRKKQKQDSRYSEMRAAFLLSSQLCLAHLPGICTTHATDVHHKRGRGQYYLDITTWLPVCRACHNWIELHPIEAKQLGFSEDRLTNSDL